MSSFTEYYSDYSEKGKQQLMHPDKLNLISHQLALILHSKSCKEKICPNSKCEFMKNILNHVSICSREGDCPLRYCRSSRRILNHWESRICGHSCPACRRSKYFGYSEGSLLSCTRSLIGYKCENESPTNTRLQTCGRSPHLMRTLSAPNECVSNEVNSHTKGIHDLTEGFDCLVLDSLIEFESQ